VFIFSLFMRILVLLYTVRPAPILLALGITMAYTAPIRYSYLRKYMPTVQVEPSKDHKVPYDLSDEKPKTLLDEMAVAGNTAELQEALGAPLDMTEGDVEREKELLRAVAEAKKPSNLSNHPTAFAAATFLRTYGQQLAMDAAQARAAITNKLMEIADCGDPRYELKALELLGKHSDIGIFTERSEVTINYKNAEDLEKAIKDRVKNLLNATVVETVSLDDQLGVLEDDTQTRLDAALGVLSEDIEEADVEEEDEDINDPI